MLGHDVGGLRLPLVEASDEERSRDPLRPRACGPDGAGQRLAPSLGSSGEARRALGAPRRRRPRARSTDGLESGEEVLGRLLASPERTRKPTSALFPSRSGTASGDPDPGKVGARADHDSGAGLGLAKEPADQRRLGGALGRRAPAGSSRLLRPRSTRRKPCTPAARLARRCPRRGRRSVPGRPRCPRPPRASPSARRHACRPSARPRARRGRRSRRPPRRSSAPGRGRRGRRRRRRARSDPAGRTARRGCGRSRAREQRRPGSRSAPRP